MWSAETRQKSGETRRKQSRMRHLAVLEVVSTEALSWQEVCQRLQAAGFEVRPDFIAGVPSETPTMIHGAGQTWYLFAVKA